MEIIFLFVGAILGALFSWLIQHTYYAKTTREQETLFNKLSAEVRSVILEDQRQNLSISELNQIIMHKALDGRPRRVFNYVVCPKCGSNNLDRQRIIWTICDPNSDPNSHPKKQPGAIIDCKDCGWNESDMDDEEISTSV